MKMKSLGLFIVGAVAATISRRDFDTVLNDIYSIQSATNALTQAAQNQGDVADAFNNLDIAYNQGTTDIGNSPQFTEGDVYQISGPLDQLSTDTQNMVNATATQRQAFLAANVGCYVSASFHTTLDDGITFANALLNNFPQNYAQTVKTFLDLTINALEQGVNDFNNT